MKHEAQKSFFDLYEKTILPTSIDGLKVNPLKVKT